MVLDLPEVRTLRALTSDGWLLFGTRTARLLAYGALSVILALYLVQLGFSDYQLGFLLTCTLVGDAMISLGIATMAVVDADERSAAAGVTSVARTLGSALAPLLTGALLSASLLSLPFVLAGGLKTVYDILLYRSFRAVQPPEEQEM